MMNRLTDAMNFQAQALTLRAERQRLLASNIANADTPGYQSRDLDFAKALREATSPAATGSNQTLTERTQSVLQNSLSAMTSMDSNTVDMDRERASFADNTVKYEASLRFINGSVRTIMDAMKSPNAA
ncbi:flagellar basal body rod protein FlgB [Roseateles sp. SL47]|jgi:flagellar basal-body rod protein FlgB|uniref:flagellar basal body rod protein FlgB n=1 Tax=Roseateles sp. SL47 TaxID=2995138 RepID=UPI00227213BA|nr:flagellar basal body rod protein FlgB [Roseateles sp. SL47]WAC72500.1 flagellar basal body rod protein FlgB [Roseateles sp. SL47]